MRTIILQKKRHRECDWLEIRFDYDAELIQLVRGISGVKFSSTHRSWLLPFTRENVALAEEKLKPHAILDTLQLKRDLLSLGGPEISAYLEELTRYMRSRRYSENTVKTYTEGVKIFFNFYWPRSPAELSNTDLIHFNNAYIIANKLSASYQNQIINGIKLFYTHIVMRDMDVALIHRPRGARNLPNVLSKEEVRRIIGALVNLKHRTMISLIYSCGLRCGELLSLKPEHIQSSRNLLLVKSGKGNRDRIVPLSDKTITLLREYYKMYKPKVYLFEGMHKGEMYDPRSLQSVLKGALQRAGIEKPATLHWLRHSYATHLLESGTDLRYIQEILGHRSSRTTEIYTHVSTQLIQRIQTPFDSL